MISSKVKDCRKKLDENKDRINSTSYDTFIFILDNLEKMNNFLDNIDRYTVFEKTSLDNVATHINIIRDKYASEEEKCDYAMIGDIVRTLISAQHDVIVDAVENISKSITKCEEDSLKVLDHMMHVLENNEKQKKEVKNAKKTKKR